MTETTESSGREEETTEEVFGIDEECFQEQDETDYDPLGVNYDGPEVALEKANDTNYDNNDGNESDDSIIELDMEQCPMCTDNFESKQDLVTHLAKRHFEAGLLKDLRKHNWEDGSLMCPKCRDVKDDVFGHWAREHNKVEEMVKRCLSGGEIRLTEERQYCHKFIEKWFKVDVSMANDKGTDIEIKNQLADPEEDDSSIENEDEIIVLDDSSDESDIEILESAESSKEQHKTEVKTDSPISGIYVQL